MQRLNRGTTVFCAQEAYHHQQGQGALFGIKHLKQVDAWAYGIVLFHLTRPEVSISIDASPAPTPLDGPRHFLRQKAKPTLSNNYKELQATEWLLFENIYDACTQWNPAEWPPAHELVVRLDCIKICSYVRTSGWRSARYLLCKTMIEQLLSQLRLAATGWAE